MNARRWTTLCAVSLLALSGTAARAQRVGSAMMVVIKLNDGKDPWQYAPRMATAAGMQLVGVSVSTNTAVFIVPNETDKSRGVVAARNQKTILDGFPGVVLSYNYGVNYPGPQDLEAPRPVTPPPGNDRVGNDRGGNDRGGNGYGYGDNRGRPAARFSGRDRAVLRDWYYGRRDAWIQIREGAPLDDNLRALSYPAPPELARSLGPLYGNDRYLIIGDNLVLIDGRYFVLDVIRFSDLRDDRRGPPR